jgi:xylulokinase
MSKKRLVLGMEFSTQSVKIVVLDLLEKSLIMKEKFSYEEIFPHYQTSQGVLPNANPEIRHTQPLMIVDSLEYSFEMLKRKGVDLASIETIKLDAMQHCTVYLSSHTLGTLKSLNPIYSLNRQIEPLLTRKTSPIWEDRSTRQQTDWLSSQFPNNELAKLTANRPEMRFPAAQILKWAQENPVEYSQTSHIMLLSAFLTSILSGKIAPVDTGDGWGSNLNSTSLHFPSWNRKVIGILQRRLDESGCKSPLIKKLGTMTHYDSVIGKISPYFTMKFGLNKNCTILAGTGDNPATLLGCGGETVISLGSSYTVNGSMRKLELPLGANYNVFGYTRGKAMALTCFTNGGKLHELFLRKYCGIPEGTQLQEKDWQNYVERAGSPVLSESEPLMLPYLYQESVPVKPAGIIRSGFGENDAQTNIRSLHVSQVLSLKRHSSHLGRTDSICIVGGVSSNRLFRQFISDVFQCQTYVIRNSDFAAPLGCAIAAARHSLSISYEKAAEYFVQKEPHSLLMPHPEHRPTVEVLLDRYAQLESSIP